MRLRNLLFMAFVFPQLAQASFTVLLTSFDPFGGSQANNTQPIVGVLTQMASTLGTDVVLKTCNLPVVYDQAADVAMDCVEKIKPDAVVSFGEAACSIRIETAATNLDRSPGFPDNAGQVRNGNKIVSGGVERSPFDFPVPDMYCALGGQASSVVVSASPGAFVCNNTAYHLSLDLEAKGIPFTFIHVPNSKCNPSQVDPQANAGLIAPMLRAANSKRSAEPSSVSPS
jgi:pyrrolidone-carboxylate peptidase